ncbi:sensor histidine kinase [Sorangium cellulosum]|uniref:histidine kinase n=1 Tax=Sorangium cellulosum TaxID=56 RepID=A0A2L0EVH0_SORCE|nr:ATP-binding protein [Sorangium cellulosum]AUX43293.1 sensor histidine kinase [Sorangium cellulosum]
MEAPRVHAPHAGPEIEGACHAATAADGAAREAAEGARDGAAREAAPAPPGDAPLRELRALLDAQLATASALSEASSLAEAAPRVLAALVEHLGWDVAALWLTEPEASAVDEAAEPGAPEALRCVAVRAAAHLDEEALAASCRRELPLADAPDLVGEALRSSVAVLRADADGAAAQATRDPGAWRAACAVPIRGASRSVGVLELRCAAPRRADEALLRVLSSVGSQIGQAVARRRAEQEGARAAVELRALFRAIPDVCFRLDAELTIIDYSAPRGIDLCTPPESFLGKRMAEVLPGEIAERLEHALREARAAGTAAALEYAVPVEGGERHVEARMGPFRDGHSLVLVRDITERRRAEEALRQRDERSRESQKMEALGRLAGGIAHDFNNMLMVMLGYGELLLRRLGPDSPLRRDALQITKAGERASALTRQLLAMSRRKVLQREVLDINAVVLDMQSMLQRLIGENIDLRTNVGRELGSIKVDRSQLEQVLLNLVVNARDAMPRGGRLVVETLLGEPGLSAAARSFAPAERDADAAPASAGPYVVLAVSDSGSGMDQDTLSHLFEPFFTTKARGKGTGLGLATVYGIVSQSGGHIEVESEIGRGTTFRVYLPRVEDRSEVAPARARPSPAGGDETVLVVEDDDAVRKLIVEVLERRGYGVLSASSGEEALDALAHDGVEAIDLLLTDLVMPGMNGRELAERALAIQPRARVLYMSGYADDVLAGVDGELVMLQKPFTPETLAQRVRDMLDRR